MTERVLQLLRDGRWHDLSELVQRLRQPEHRVEQVLRFYSEFHFVEFDQKARRVIIDPSIGELYR